MGKMERSFFVVCAEDYHIVWWTRPMCCQERIVNKDRKMRIGMARTQKSVSTHNWVQTLKSVPRRVVAQISVFQKVQRYVVLLTPYLSVRLLLVPFGITRIRSPATRRSLSHSFTHEALTTNVSFGFWKAQIFKSVFKC